MTNKEIFKEKICELACEGKEIAINKNTNTPCDCNEIICTKCTLQKNCLWKSHTVAVREWCNAEYEEHCDFKKDELVEVSSDGVNWSLRYFSNMTRNKKGEKEFLTFVNGQNSNETGATWPWKYCRKYGKLGGLVKEENND